MLILTIAEDLDKLLQNRCMAPITPLSELCRVMVMAVHVPIVLVITILSAEDRWAHRTCEMINVIFML